MIDQHEQLPPEPPINLQAEIKEYGYFKFELKNKRKCRGFAWRNLRLTLRGKRSVIAKRIKVFQ